MPNYNSPHMPDNPSSSFHMNMIAPGVLGVKIICRLDSMITGKIWRDTNLEIDRTSPRWVIADASRIAYYKRSGI